MPSTKLRRVLQLHWTLTLMCLMAQPTSSARTQTYTIYTEPNRSGRNETFTTNVQDLFAISPMVRNGLIKYKCIERGLWLEYSGVNYNYKNTNSYRSDNILHPGICFSPSSPVQSIRHIGHSDLEQPGLSLYKGENFTGEELYFDGSGLRLPLSIGFGSFGFTGLESWTLYAGTDYTGESNFCLQPQPMKVDEAGTVADVKYMVHNSQTQMVVGSIRRGCGHHSTHNGHNGHNGHHKMHPNTKKTQPSPTLFLYSQITQHNPTLSMDGTELKLPSTGHSFLGYSIGGVSNWTIFTGNEFNGVSKCLIALENSTNSGDESSHSEHSNNHNSAVIHNLTTGEEGAWLVGSIRRGCDGGGSSGSGGAAYLHMMAIITMTITILTIIY